MKTDGHVVDLQITNYRLFRTDEMACPACFDYAQHDKRNGFISKSKIVPRTSSEFELHLYSAAVVGIGQLIR